MTEAWTASRVGKGSWKSTVAGVANCAEAERTTEANTAETVIICIVRICKTKVLVVIGNEEKSVES